MLQME